MDRDLTIATTTRQHASPAAQLPRLPPPTATTHSVSGSIFTADATSRSLAPASAPHSPSRLVAVDRDLPSRRPFASDLLQLHHQQQDGPSSSSNSQDTNTTNDSADQIFTPPMSDAGMSAANGNASGSGSGNDSSQESQLMHLSHIAAAQEKMHQLEAATAAATSTSGLSRKRMADGVVKHTRQSSSASPVYHGGHSRNTSAVSIASTTGSRIGELSAELKARLSYAMVKVNNGWQSHSIDEVETLASQAASPTSSTSTVHGRHGSSASPQLPLSSHRPASSTNNFPAPPDSTWKGSPNASSAMSPPSVTKNIPALAPPVSIQPSRPSLITRRNSNPRYTPTFLSNSHHGSPQTPAQPSPNQGTPDHRGLRTPVVDPILFSPHQNVREQDAIESLLFMSSPGNSANLKHNFPSSSQPLSSMRNGITSASASPHRTALPSSQPRKSLPSGRPAPSSQPLPHGHSQPKRVGFDKSPSSLSDMDVDEQYGTPHGAYSQGTPRRKANGAEGHHARQLSSLSMSSGLGVSARTRPALGDADIEQMLDRVAADESSDSEGEIPLPLSSRSRREGAGIHA